MPSESNLRLSRGFQLTCDTRSPPPAPGIAPAEAGRNHIRPGSALRGGRGSHPALGYLCRPRGPQRSAGRRSFQAYTTGSRAKPRPIRCAPQASCWPLSRPRRPRGSPGDLREVGPKVGQRKEEDARPVELAKRGAVVPEGGLEQPCGPRNQPWLARQHQLSDVWETARVGQLRVHPRQW
eukprot:scaffold136037_cov45-Prasinocladus_malaysianus.AAC.1